MEFITLTNAFTPLHAVDIEAFQGKGIDVSNLSTGEKQVLAEEVRVFLQASVDLGQSAALNHSDISVSQPWISVLWHDRIPEGGDRPSMA